MSEKLTSDEREQFAREHQKLIYHIVNQYQHQFNYSELLSAGNLGMAKALMNFDKSRNIKFSTFACNCIYREVFQMMRKEKKHRNVSLETPVHTNKQGVEITAMDLHVSEDQAIGKVEMNQVINQVLNGLDNKRRKVMIRFFQNWRQQDIANEFGCTHQNINVIVNKTLKLIAKEYWTEKVGI